MASEGPNNPGTMISDDSVGTNLWNDVDNAKLSDDADANASANTDTTSHYLKATNFGFTIPSGVTIDGITVEIEQMGEATGSATLPDEFSIKIVKGGTISGDEKSTNAVLPTVDTYITYGGATDLWGLAWTDTDINAANFGVVFAADLHGAPIVAFSIARVDHVRITVHYTEEAAAVGNSQMMAANF